jgi:hypothetical protein
VVDENKVRLMTRLAIYEKNEKDKGLIRSKYFQGDYVRYNVLKTMVTSTIVYWGVVCYYAFMNFDSLLARVSDVDYFDVMYKLIGWYVAFCVVYFLIATLLYNYRYNKSKEGLIQYNSDLRDLIELEGGPMHRSKLVNDENRTMGDEIPFKDTGKTEVTPKPYAQNKTAVKRSDIVRQRQLEQDRLREEQIKQNAARLAAQAREKEQRERQAAADREKIQERRKQLEREQLERIRREQQMMRENHTYAGNNMNQNYSGNINRSGGSGSRTRTNANNEGRNN